MCLVWSDLHLFIHSK